MPFLTIYKAKKADYPGHDGYEHGAVYEGSEEELVNAIALVCANYDSVRSLFEKALLRCDEIKNFKNENPSPESREGEAGA